MNSLIENTLRCPTCRAAQEWSDTCRRCKCDLRLLRAAAEEYRRRRWLCLSELHSGRTKVALQHARDCLRIAPDAESRRLMAVCALLDGDWRTALVNARFALEA